MYRRKILNKNAVWHTVIVISADEYITYGSGARKIVFTAQKENNYSSSPLAGEGRGEGLNRTRQCIYWGNIELNAGDKLQVQGRVLESGVFICTKLLRLEKAENDNLPASAKCSAEREQSNECVSEKSKIRGYLFSSFPRPLRALPRGGGAALWLLPREEGLGGGVN